jgi:hypothetical protein
LTLVWELLRPGGRMIIANYLAGTEQDASKRKLPDELRTGFAVDSFVTLNRPRLRVLDRGHFFVLERATDACEEPTGTSSPAASAPRAVVSVAPSAAPALAGTAAPSAMDPAAPPPAPGATRCSPVGTFGYDWDAQRLSGPKAPRLSAAERSLLEGYLNSAEFGRVEPPPPAAENAPLRALLRRLGAEAARREPSP